MGRVPPRTLSPQEVDIVARLIEFTAGQTFDPPDLAELRVVGRCDCGCATVDFLAEEVPGARVAADAYGTTRNGVDVGVMLWTRDGQLAGLEVYSLADGVAELPLPESLVRAGGAPAS